LRRKHSRTHRTNTHAGKKSSPGNRKKKIYRPPALQHFGSIDALTLGGQGGAGDAHGGPNTKTPCWIAEVLYGVDDHRTHLLRSWLNGVYARTTIGSAVVAVYRACGERVARWVRRSALLRRMLTPLFDAGVAAALRHYTFAAR
jgi:hypothetical protein